MRRLLVPILAVGLAGCSILQADPYPLNGTGGSQQTGPAGIGDPFPATVIFMSPRPGDRIELLSAEPVGVGSGGEVTFYFSPPVHKPDGTILIGERLEPLSGAIVTGETMGVVAEITAHEPGTYTLSAVRLHYRLNGGKEQVAEGIDVVFTVCADDPKPADCALPSAE